MIRECWCLLFFPGNLPKMLTSGYNLTWKMKDHAEWCWKLVRFQFWIWVSFAVTNWIISYKYSFHWNHFPVCTPLSWPHGVLSKLFQPWILVLALWLVLANEMLVEMTWADAWNSLYVYQACHLCLCHHHEKKIS